MSNERLRVWLPRPWRGQTRIDLVATADYETDLWALPARWTGAGWHSGVVTEAQLRSRGLRTERVEAPTQEWG